MAALLIALIASGVYMVRLPDVGFDTWKITVILVHKALGMLALFAVVVRLLWRWVNVLPRLVEAIPDGSRSPRASCTLRSTRSCSRCL